MGWFGESQEEKEARVVEEAHKEGQDDGAHGNVNFIGEVVKEHYYSNVCDGASEAAGEAYKAGLENGKENQPND